jgi:uncharacterized membrane protein
VTWFAWTEALTMLVNPALRSFSVGVRSYFVAVTVLSVSMLIWRQSWSDTAKGVREVRRLLD